MAKQQNKGTSGSAGKGGKGKKFKKRERKNVPYGLVFVQASLQQHDRHGDGSAGEHPVVEELGFARLPRIAQGHAICGAAGCRWCRNRRA